MCPYREGGRYECTAGKVALELGALDWEGGRRMQGADCKGKRNELDKEKQVCFSGSRCQEPCLVPGVIPTQKRLGPAILERPQRTDI